MQDISNFWDELYTPIPMYTPENVSDTVDYINSLEGVLYGPIYITALGYVTAELAGKKIKDGHIDGRFLEAAYEAAQKRYSQARFDAKVTGEYIPVVRWLYAKTAIADYMNYMKR